MASDARRADREARRHPGLIAVVSLAFFSLFLLASVIFSSSAAALAPVVLLTSPTGGEDWTGGSSHTVLWSVSDLDTFNVTYWINVSANGGSSWSTLGTGIVTANGSSRSTAWTVPLVNTTTMLVRLCAVDNLTAVCTTSSSFRVDSTHPVGTPSPADAQTNVNPRAVVRVNFSEAMQTVPPALSTVTFIPAVTVSSLNWTTASQLTVTHDDFAPATSYSWFIDCSIRDASNPGNPVVGCGSPMWSFSSKALEPPVVALSSPVGGAAGEDWTGGSNHSIRWSVYDPDTTAVSYWINGSTDDGFSWSVLVNGTVAADGSNRSSPWATPLVNSTTIRVRVCASDGNATVCATSQRFEIDSTPPVAVPTPPDGSSSVAPDDVVRVNFSEPMNTASLSPFAVTFTPAVSVLSVAWSSAVQLVVTHAPFAYSTTYSGSLACSILDRSSPGNPVAGCGAVLWTFRTAAAPNTRPSAVSVAVDGATAPPATNHIENHVNPTFSWTFVDPDANASQYAFEWEVHVSGTGDLVHRTGTVTSSVTASAYAGPALASGGCYAFFLRVNDGTDWSNWNSLSFCLAPETVVAGPVRPLAVYEDVLPVTISSVLAAIVVVYLKPGWYRALDVVSVGLAAYILFVLLSEMVPSLQPFRLDLSLEKVAAAALTVFAVVVHFASESAGAALDPTPVQKIGLNGVGAVAMIGVGVFSPPLAPIVLGNLFVNFGFAMSTASRMKVRGLGPFALARPSRP